MTEMLYMMLYVAEAWRFNADTLKKLQVADHIM